MAAALPVASPLRAAGRVLLVVCAVSALTLSGGALAPPAAPASWPPWVDQLDAVTMLFAGIRLVALVAGWYVLAVTAAALVLTVVRPAAVRPFIRRVTSPATRGIVHALLGVSVTAVTAMPSAALAGTAAPTGPAILVVAGDPATSRPPPPGAPPVAARVPATAVQARPQWRVRAGDHFWSIAHECLRDQRATEPSDAAVARYWRRLLEHNRDRLADPSNPDLLLVGQLLELPPVDSRP